ncbi:excisionase family DNA binding protein [Rhodoligotrophos appendicifer]|uniref:helix-turn-helix domain-containing protein n=1 Tax=Rhodoligotrophos appendicifer TaxID=987056 RepID=UPI0011854ACD|nr:helix-turn-helix domain-containing protein [Rhodoligotrophos appendicifer]
MNINSEPLLSPEEAARLLKTTAGTLAAWRCTGHMRIPFVKFGRKVLYRRSDLERYLDQHTVNASAAAE